MRTQGVTLRMPAILMLLTYLACGVVSAQVPSFKPIPDSSLIVRDGSPLDFSRWLPTGPAGANGRVVASGGRLAFAKTPDTPAKFSCVSMYLSGAQGGYPDKATADVMAHQIRLHGYNVVRFHYVEATLMTGRLKDFDYDPDQRDRFYYFLAALKKEGIYWLFDAMSSENGAIGNVFPHRWIQKYNLKFLVQVDESAREHWRKIVDTLYVPVNPYTGLSLLADPALAGITMVNEGGMNFLAQTRENGWRPELVAPFQAWLKTKYANNAALATAWGDLRTDESLTGTLRIPAGTGAYSPRMRDFQQFLVTLETGTAQMMSAHLKARGYQGPATAYDNWNSTASSLSRSSLNWIDMHGYHDEALGFEAGASLTQVSSIDNLGKYARRLAASRQAGKPFSITEFGQPFWNKYRFEAALQVPSMAAFQGWDFACQHAEGGVDLSFFNTAPRKKALFPYNVGMDPIGRAVETVGTLLFMRGDVSPAPHRYSAQYPYDVAFKDGWYLNEVPDDINYLSWLTGIETVYPGESSTFKAPISLTPASTWTLSQGLTLTPEQKLLSNYEQGASIRINRMRSAGLLSTSNRTDVSKGIYESETGQLLIDRSTGRFIVQTPKTEAITSNIAMSGVNLKALKIASLSTPGLIAASALDDLSLAQSKKILLVFATDAENTGMTFSAPDRKTLVNMGTVPVRIQTSVAKATLSLSHSTPMKLTALTLNGERGAAVPVSQVGGNISFTLDTGSTITTFFVLEPK